MRRAGRLVFSTAAAFALLVAAGSARAADERAMWDAPRVFSIQPRPERLGHEFQLGLGVLPTDAFYVGLVGTASYTLHFTDFWAWEIAGGGYSHNFDTSLKSDLLNDYGVEPVGGGGDRIRMFGTSGVVVKPLFGKLALFNEKLLHGETYFSLAIGPMLKGKFVRVATSAGVGLRLWWTPVVSLRIDVRDLMSFSHYLPDHSLFLLLSASFNVARKPEAP